MGPVNKAKFNDFLLLIKVLAKMYRQKDIDIVAATVKRKKNAK